MTCSLGTLANGGSATITLVVTLPLTTGSLINSATVTSSAPDPNTANQIATATIMVIPAAAIPAFSWLGLMLFGMSIMFIGMMRSAS